MAQNHHNYTYASFQLFYAINIMFKVIYHLLFTPVPRSRIPRVPDSGIDTGGTCGPGLARVSWVPEDPRFLGSHNVDASTPLLEGRAWTHEQRVSQCSPITEGKTLQSAPRMASATPGGVMQVPEVPGTGRGNSLISPRITAAMGMVGSPNQPDSALDGRPVLRRPYQFTNMVVPRFDITVDIIYWQQHQQVLNAISESNGPLPSGQRCCRRQHPASQPPELSVLMLGLAKTYSYQNDSPTPYTGPQSPGSVRPVVHYPGDDVIHNLVLPG